MEKNKALYAIYKYDFHKAIQRSIQAEANGIDGEKQVKTAQKCFASIFDKNSIDNLSKTNKKKEVTRLHNDVMARMGDILIWRVNNCQLKEWWTQQGKDQKGIDRYEKLEIESTPYANIIIDNRPGHCIMAIEKSTAWGSDPDKLRNMLLENFNRILADKFDLEMRIEARMNPTDIWDFMHQRINEYNDYVKHINFSFQNPKKINKTSATNIKSQRLKGMLQIVQASKALEGMFAMTFDESNKDDINQKNRDLAEMVRLCGDNGYDISITFNEYKVYRINDYVKAFYPMSTDILQQFRLGTILLNGKPELEEWFDKVEEETREYANESEIPKRRNKKHQQALLR